MDPMTTERYTGLLDTLKTTIESTEFLTRHRRSKTDFTRKRCLHFTVVLLFLVNMIKRSLQDELDEFFKALSGDPVAQRRVSKSAMTQARVKLRHTAFIELNDEQVTYFYNHFEPKRWHGFRLIAIDGSMTDLPKTAAICQHFGVWRPKAGGRCPKARVSQLFDVLNTVTLDALIAPKDKGERTLFAEQCHKLGPGDLLLLDRGYPAFGLFAKVKSTGADFCARMPLGRWKIVDAFIGTQSREQIVELSASYDAKKTCQSLGLSAEPIPIRLVRYDLADGQIGVLATSLLDDGRLSGQQIVELYAHRWPVEEDFRQMKSRLEVENWTGKSVEAIYQDFHATVFTKNLTAIIAQPAQSTVEKAK